MLSALSIQFIDLLKTQEIPNFNLNEFVKPELDMFRENCNFTEDELEYFELKAKGKSIVAIAQQMNVSESQVSKLAKRVKLKIVRII